MPMILSQKIENIKNNKLQIDNLIAMQKAELKPVLTDVSLAIIVYKWLLDITTSDKQNLKGYYSTKEYFILIIMALYSPSVYINNITPREKNINKTIADIIKVNRTSVSTTKNRLKGLYEVDRTFRNNLDYIYSKIIEKINQYNLAANNGNEKDKG